MSSYIGRHAELYDLFYADKPYAKEAAFVHLCLQRFSVGETKRMLELACGTGSHALHLEKYGYEITATDYSQDMLEHAQAKASLVSSTVEFNRQDMRTLDLPGQPFDAVICLFDSIGYVATNEALSHVFKSVCQHLRPEGLFILEFWHAAAMLKKWEPLRIRRWFTPECQVLRLSETRLDCAKQLAYVTYTVYELHNVGRYTSLTESQTNRFFLVQEMRSWLTMNGFEPLKWFCGFSEEESISEDTWHVVAVARRQ